MFSVFDLSLHTLIAILYSLSLGIWRSFFKVNFERKVKYDHVNLGGRYVIITGSNTGIGKATAIRLCSLGANVILACRDISKGTKARDDVEMAARNISAHAGNVFFISLDLSSLQSVVRFVQQYNAKFPPVDILINNAGLNTNGKTMDGINVLFQVNYLSHYLLTRLFIKSRPPQHSKELRVINLSSLMHHTGTDQFIKSAYSNYPIASPYYSDSKLYMTLLSLELNKRYSLLNTALKQRKNVLALSVNPGGVRSDIWRSIPKIFAGLFDIVMRLLFLTCEQGCVTSVYGAVADVNEVKDYLSQATPSCNKGGNWIIHPFLPYLVPYYIPYDWLFFETLGPFGGPRFGKVSLPKDVMKVSEELWQFSEEICLEKLTKYGVKIDLE